MVAIALLVLALGIAGHGVLWVALVNRIHALGIRRRWVNVLTLLCLALFGVLPLVIAAAYYFQVDPLERVAWGYIVFCAVVCIWGGVQRWRWHRHPERGESLLIARTTPVRHATARAELTAPGVPTWLSRLPGNEVLSICVVEKEIAMPRLPPEGDGVRIAHITDLHMSGRLTRAYFEQVVEATNATQPDIIAITGDIVERSPCLDWIDKTLGRLAARHGVYYVLGNHDRHVDETALKSALESTGIVHLGGACREVVIGDLPVILAGNELPWYGPASDFSTCPRRGSDGLPLRILLSHSPDQFEWAQAHDVDLILAGHLHGGQFCFPWLGAVTAPSAFGVRYASGIFRQGDTVMHVSRGTGSLTPIRFNCPPEIAVLVLKSGGTARA